MTYPVPQCSVRTEKLIRKSRFIAITAPAPDVAAARQLLADVSAEFQDARHICYAYIAGHPNTGPRASSDDGEPQGTAGKPIMNVLVHSGIGEIVSVVVRYFGGIKLGAGGLARAYGGAVADTIKTLPTVTPVSCQAILIEAPYASENDIRHLLARHRASDIVVTYQSGLCLRCELPTASTDQLRTDLDALGRGKFRIASEDDQTE